jgi:hypothetical protein
MRNFEDRLTRLGHELRHRPLPVEELAARAAHRRRRFRLAGLATGIVVAAAGITAGVLTTASSGRTIITSGPPPSPYLAPVPSTHDGLSPASGCPNPAGLEPMVPSDSQKIQSILNEYGRVDRNTDLHDSDEAWWPAVNESWSRRSQAPSSVQTTVPAARSIGPAASTPYAQLITSNCGPLLIQDSYSAVAGPASPALESYWYFLKRYGVVLLYFNT